MPFLYQYLIKFSISLAVLYTFYYVVLRPLTFYQWNRFYLVCYTLLSFIIPFINVTGWLSGKDINDSYLINSIPAVDKLALTSFGTRFGGTNILSIVLSWNFVGLLFLAGALVMFMRIFYQYLSLSAMKRKAVLLKTGDFEFYDVNSNITPFSFANAIFINSRLHTEEEFHKILEHEFVHVKQKHTIDIIVAELVCVFNWFNPFAWLIRKTIRQNLEFIADNNVLESGIDPRQYQYLLLKVMGLPQYSITNNFSFSSLKKRIAMMNKIKTARVHLVRFLFVLPLLAVMLLAFRDRLQPAHLNHETDFSKYERNMEPADISTYSVIGADTIPLTISQVQSNTKKSVEIGVNDSPVKGTGVRTNKIDTPVTDENNIATEKSAVVVAVTSNHPVTTVRPVTGNIPVTIVKQGGVVTKVVTTAVTVNAPVTSVAPVTSFASVADTTSPKLVLRGINGISNSPLYILDGKMLAEDDFQKINPNSIKSISVIKGVGAMAIYGDHARDGVIDIRTKDNYIDKDITITSKAGVNLRGITEFDGLMIVDGKESNLSNLKQINPDNIESVNVLKDKESTAIYNEKGKNGVIIITTKKKAQ